MHLLNEVNSETEEDGFQANEVLEDDCQQFPLVGSIAATKNLRCFDEERSDPCAVGKGPSNIGDGVRKGRFGKAK